MQKKNKEYNEREQQIAENRSRNTLFERRENLQKHESYASERRQYDAIRNGQTDRIQSVFQLTPDGTPGILSRNELRNSKNMFIAGITLFTRAAIEGGVPEETAYALSDGYIQTVEECTSKSSIEKLSQKAALRFAQEVQKSGMQHYSREIEAAVKYIHLHLHVPVTLEETAEAAGISASYLSRLFKKETGMLFVDYIQKERIEAACNMLTYSDYTAAQISEYLCFSTQSYFIKIFRKYTGTTPAKYKKYNTEGLSISNIFATTLPKTIPVACTICPTGFVFAVENPSNFCSPYSPGNRSVKYMSL